MKTQYYVHQNDHGGIVFVACGVFRLYPGHNRSQRIPGGSCITCLALSLHIEFTILDIGLDPLKLGCHHLLVFAIQLLPLVLLEIIRAPVLAGVSVLTAEDVAASTFET